MTPNQVLRYLREHRISVRLWGGVIRLSPPERVTTQLAESVRLWKPRLVWLLARRLPMLADQPAYEIWVTPATWSTWQIEHQALELRIERERNVA